MEAEYKAPCDQTMHITAFGWKLDREKKELKEDKIKISSAQKLQHYMEQMYKCGLFDLLMMTTWANKTTKTTKGPSKELMLFNGYIDFDLKN